MGRISAPIIRSVADGEVVGVVIVVKTIVGAPFLFNKKKEEEEHIRAEEFVAEKTRRRTVYFVDRNELLHTKFRNWNWNWNWNCHLMTAVQYQE